MPVLLVPHNSLRIIVLEYLLFSAAFIVFIILVEECEIVPKQRGNCQGIAWKIGTRRKAGKEQDDYGLKTKKLAPFQYRHYLKAARELSAISTLAQINSSESSVTLLTPGGIWPMPDNLDGPNRLVLHLWVTGILEGAPLSISLWEDLPSHGTCDHTWIGLLAPTHSFSWNPKASSFKS